MARCPGLHCPGCGSGSGFPILPVLIIAAVAAFGSTIATVLADIIDAALIVSVTALTALGAVLVVKVRRGRFGVIQRGPGWSGIATRPAQAIPAPRRPAIEAPRQPVPAVVVIRGTKAGTP